MESGNYFIKPKYSNRYLTLNERGLMTLIDGKITEFTVEISENNTATIGNSELKALLIPKSQTELVGISGDKFSFKLIDVCPNEYIIAFQKDVVLDTNNNLVLLNKQNGNMSQIWTFEKVTDIDEMFRAFYEKCTHKKIPNDVKCYGRAIPNKTILGCCNYKDISDFYAKKIEANYVLVRGKKTKRILEIESDVLIGDPFLIAPFIYPKTVGSEAEFEAGFVGTNAPEGIHAIKYSTDDICSLIDEMVKCKVIVSEGIVPIILAHAYGIPALRLKLNYTQSFEFIDYYSSFDKLEFNEISEFKKEDLSQAYIPKDIKEVQENVKKAFDQVLSSSS